MTPQHKQPSLLIAAHEPSQGKALAEIIIHIYPGVAVSLVQELRGPSDASVAVAFGSDGTELARQCARVRECSPSAALLIIAPRLDEDSIAKVAGHGASSYVASPCEPAVLVQALDRELRRVRFGGRCGRLETSELLRLYAAASGTGVLHLSSPEHGGSIHLEDGQPVDAQCAELRGADAVGEMLEWREVSASWIAGRSASARTIVGRLEGLLERELAETADEMLELREAPADVLNKLSRLAQVEDVLAAYLMRDTEVLIGHLNSGLDEVVVGRALARLAQVFQDMEDLQGEGAGTQIQATVGPHRLVVDRIGPTRLGFQVGVVVVQAAPVCKSLRRLLRQMDRSFRRALLEQERSARRGGGAASRREAKDLHRVA